MKRSILLLALPTALAITACDRPERAAEDAKPAVKVPEPATPGTAGTTGSRPRNIGEGEMEALDSQAAIDQFQRDIMGDPDLAAASNARLILRSDGRYALQGTAISGDVKDELENYAEELVGGDVENEIEVADD